MAIEVLLFNVIETRNIQLDPSSTTCMVPRMSLFLFRPMIHSQNRFLPPYRPRILTAQSLAKAFHFH